MQVQIFTNESSTVATRDDVEYIKEFFKGSFLPVKCLMEDLGNFGDVTTHILSEEYGYLRGSDRINKIDEINSDDPKIKFSEQLLNACQSADVIVILLTTDKFESTVGNYWNKIEKNISPNSIWCLGVSKSALSSIDLSRLHNITIEVLIYYRVGVARINSKTSSKLVDIVSSNVKQ